MDMQELAERFALAAVHAAAVSGKGVKCAIRLTPVGFEVAARITDENERQREITRLLSYLEVLTAKGPTLHWAIDFCVERLEGPPLARVTFDAA